jgi:hypothetical protein
MTLGDSTDLVALGLHQKNEIIYFLIREVLSEFGMWIRFLESIGYPSVMHDERKEPFMMSLDEEDFELRELEESFYCDLMWHYGG